MTLFWVISASVVFGILLIATLIELNGARTGFHGANGIFLFASGVIAVFALPVVFIATWIWSDFWTAVKACLTGGACYAALFVLVLHLFSRLGRAMASGSAKR
jgi:hypothetical protein